MTNIWTCVDITAEEIKSVKYDFETLEGHSYALLHLLQIKGAPINGYTNLTYNKTFNWKHEEQEDGSFIVSWRKRKKMINLKTRYYEGLVK